MKVIRMQNFVTVLLDNGSILQSQSFTDSQYEALMQCADDEEVISLFNPRIKEIKEEKKEIEDFLEKISHSSFLSYEGGSVYWKEISHLSIPESLAKKILIAEEENNEVLITSYRNFWTLMSLNPDPLCRKNLFKFLEKWGMVIMKSGFFVGYRNVDTTLYEDVFTDHHSHSFKIKLGEMVFMDRKKCDMDSTVSCSRGLHIGGTSWLNANYFGDVGIVCLVNPADVVAVPMNDEEYGKLRCCAYLPVKKCVFDRYGKVIPVYLEDGIDDSNLVSDVLYDGVLNTNDVFKYQIKIPEIPEINPVSITANVLNIARQSIKNEHRRLLQ